jgi:ArsR family transcriptional regulator
MKAASRTSGVPLAPAARLFKAVGDEARLRIVALLSHGELCVCHLEAALEIPQPSASRHLAVLRAAGLVEARREGTWVYYRLAAQADELCRSQLKSLVKAFARDEQLGRDVERLLKSCGPNSCK